MVSSTTWLTVITEGKLDASVITASQVVDQVVGYTTLSNSVPRTRGGC